MPSALDSIGVISVRPKPYSGVVLRQETHSERRYGLGAAAILPFDGGEIKAATDVMGEHDQKMIMNPA
jgi:hypothetical protein